MGTSTGASNTGTVNHGSTHSGSSNVLGYTPSTSIPSAQNIGTGAGGVSSSPALQSPAINGTSSPNTTSNSNETSTSSAPAPERSQTSTPFGNSRFGGGGKPSIPAWQLAATKKSQEALNGEKKDTSASGTAVEATS